MERSNKIERSENWKQIYNLVKQIPRKEMTGDAPDAQSVATKLEELFLKLLPIQNVMCSCMVCGKEYMGEDPKMCCSGRDCGCMGMPTEPLVCSKECYDKLMNKNCT